MKYVFLTACRNEAGILPEFLEEYATVLRDSGLTAQSVLYVVDDLSTDESARILEEGSVEHGLDIRVISAPTNFGNQGAMFYGLQRIDIAAEDALITFDCDGEDDVNSIPGILELARKNAGRLVLVERGRRGESLVFHVCFWVYKLLFRFLTMKRVIPNNFMFLPGHVVPPVRRSPLAAVHLAYGVLKLNFPYIAVTRDRKPRYGGKSSQNLFSLISHGFVGLMTFYEVVVAKLFVLLIFLMAVGLAGVGAGLVLPAGYVEAHRVLAWLAGGAGLGMLASLSLLIAAAVALTFKVGAFSLRQGATVYHPLLSSQPGEPGVTSAESAPPPSGQPVGATAELASHF